MIKIRFFHPLTIVLLLLTGCQSNPQASLPDGDENRVQLTIFAASSLTEVFTQLAANYESRVPTTRLVFNFAGSQQLSYQIEQGAMVDLFASANALQMERLFSSGLVNADQVSQFASNRLVVAVYPGVSPPILSLEQLAEPGLKIVLATPDVPVGAYTLEFLEKANTAEWFGQEYQAAVLHNTVSYEVNVRLVLAKVLLGEADAGIVYASDLVGLEPEAVQQVEIPVELNAEAVYVIAPIHTSQYPQEAKAFIEFILSPAGQEVLQANGLMAPESPHTPGPAQE